MANAHRLLWIDAQIRAGRHPNATTIAAQFEITRRQAARDLEYLRHSLGAPLVYDAEHRGYQYEGETFFLPALAIGPEERAALSDLAHRYQGDGSARGIALANLFTRLAGSTFRSTNEVDGVPFGRPFEAVVEWADGEVRLVEFRSSSALLAELLGERPGWKITSPSWLREKVATRFSRIAARHAT